jgi:SAM-dependent methyltransferase
VTGRAGFRALVPWWARIGAKIVLSRLPISYAFWKRLRLFEHGTMDQPAQALGTFLEHAATGGLVDTTSGSPRLPVADGEFTVLELGPGDSLYTAVIAKALGASQIWLVDAGAFASTDHQGFVRLIAYLRQQGLSMSIPETGSAADILNHCNGRYLTDGVHSLSTMAPSSVDFSYSNAVLEHIPKGDFAVLASELKRVLKPGGVGVHRVDLKDHLGGGLNNLRFSEARWEGALFRDAGFYTNRLRFREMVAVFDRAGFECTLPRVIRWSALPIARKDLAVPFRDLTDEDLLVSGFDLVLRHKKGLS